MRLNAGLLLAVCAMSLACVSEPEPWTPGGIKDGGGDTSSQKGDLRNLDVAGGVGDLYVAEIMVTPGDAGDALATHDGVGAEQISAPDALLDVEGEIEETLPPQLEVKWMKTLGLPAGNDSLPSLVRSYTGDLIACGHSNKTQMGGGYDLWILKLSKDGEVQWENTVEKPGTQWCSSALELPNGEIIATGLNIGLVRFDFGGNQVWAKDDWYPGDNNYMSHVIQNSSGNYVVVGYRMVPGSTQDYQGVVAELTYDGDILWQDEVGELGENLDDRLNAVVELPNKDLLAVGYRTTTDDGTDTLLVGFTATGEKSFELPLQRDFDNMANAVVNSGDGYVIVAGRTNQVIVNNISQGDAWLAKMSYTGSVVWEREFSDGKSNYGHGVARPLDDALLFWYTTAAPPLEPTNCQFVGTNLLGETEWDFTLGEEANGENCYATIPDGFGFFTSGHAFLSPNPTSAFVARVGLVD